MTMQQTDRDALYQRKRIFVDGVRHIVKGTSSWHPLPEGGNPPAHPVIIQDGTGMLIETQPNPRSRLDCIIEGDAVTISEMGEVLCTGKLQPRAPWRDIVMSDGTTADSAFMGTNVWSDITLNAGGCHTANSGKGCKFCIFTATPPNDYLPSFEETLAMAARQIEATAIAVKNGWMGAVVTCVGGALPPDQRDQWTTDLLEAYMEKFRQFLGEDVVSQLPITAHVYPPKDFSQMEKWKKAGVNTVKYDLQFMDPDWYRTLCPGRGSQRKAGSRPRKPPSRYSGVTAPFAATWWPASNRWRGCSPASKNGYRKGDTATRTHSTRCPVLRWRT